MWRCAAVDAQHRRSCALDRLVDDTQTPTGALSLTDGSRVQHSSGGATASEIGARPPAADTIAGSRHHNIKEVRSFAGLLRALFASIRNGARRRCSAATDA